MRPLDTETMVLYEFTGISIPPYVIVTHLAPDELSLQKMQCVDARVKAGYEKIYRCGQMAAAYGFRYPTSEHMRWAGTFNILMSGHSAGSSGR
jgi:hypothetical protein